MKRRKQTRKRKFNRVPTSTFDLQGVSSRAYRALPSAYRNDEVLEFRIEDGLLKASPKASERDIIGNWTSTYKNGKWSR